jgi:hypothetical protein
MVERIHEHLDRYDRLGVLKIDAARPTPEQLVQPLQGLPRALLTVGLPGALEPVKPSGSIRPRSAACS